MIKLEHLHKQFEKTLAVNDLTLEVKRGELFSFLGPNGAGKTTTIKMIVGLISPSSGRIEMGGYDLEQEPQKAKSIIGYVPDAAFLYQHLTGREFLLMIGQIYGMSESRIQEKQQQLTDRLVMEEWLGDRISRYSQGMKQRLAFASAFLHDPEIMIIDEPMVGLDPKTARVIKDMLKELSHQGVTVFISTHNLNVADELSDRIAIINRGKLLGVGTVDSFQSLDGEKENLEDCFLRIVAEEEALNRQASSG